MEPESGKLELLKQINEGMHVFDANGDEVGKVNFVHFTDPAAVTTKEDRGAGEGGGDPDSTLLDVFEHDPDAGVTDRMRQLGYIRIDAKGFFTGDKYASSDQLASVSGDEVTLSVSRDSLG